MAAQPSPAGEPLDSPRDYVQVAIPPLKAAFRVYRAADPLKATKAEKHSWYGVPIALVFIMLGPSY